MYPIARVLRRATIFLLAVGLGWTAAAAEGDSAGTFAAGGQASYVVQPERCGSAMVPFWRIMRERAVHRVMHGLEMTENHFHHRLGHFSDAP